MLKTQTIDKSKENYYSLDSFEEKKSQSWF